MKRMTLDEIKTLPGLSEKRLEEIENFNDADISDCPELTDEQMAQMRRFYKRVKTKVPQMSGAF